MRSTFLALLVGALFILHQDFWFWRTSKPVVFGVLPIGLAYHVFYSIAVAGVMWLLVHFAWPALSEVEGPALSEVEGPALSEVEGPALSEVEGPALSDVEGSETRR